MITLKFSTKELIRRLSSLIQYMAELNNNMQYEEFYLNHLSTNQQIMYAEYKDLYDRQDGYLKRLYMELSISLHRMDDILYLEALKLIYII